MEASSRHDQIARNEVVFREVNDRVKAVDETLSRDAIVDDPLDLVEFFCECGDIGCMMKISMTSAEYEELRSHPARFAVELSHEIPSVETIVATTDRFTVVEKHAGQDAIARASDPRSS